MIRIQNIYYMLAYAFRALQGQGYRDLAVEEFPNAADLCAEILIRGVGHQLKRGLGREYTDETDFLSCPRGKIELAESLETRSILRRQLVCSYSEFSADTAMNRIVKATCKILLRSNIVKERKRKIKRLLPFSADVADIDLARLSESDWRLRFNRNNQTYRALMGICYLVCKGLLQTQEDGSVRLMGYFDDQSMCRLYERFILEYYRQEHPELTVSASYIKWALDEVSDDAAFSASAVGANDMLPVMKSDVMLSLGGSFLIIDAKYYTNTMQRHFGKSSIHSGNLYQMFTYVKNKEAQLIKESEAGTRSYGRSYEVSGLILYAGTDEDIQPDGVYRISGNMIGAKTLDLNQPFEGIRACLDAIASSYFPKDASVPSSHNGGK